jgi:hypothetical protein
VGKRISRLLTADGHEEIGLTLSGSELADAEVDVADLVGLEALALVLWRARQVRDAIGPKPDPPEIPCCRSSG